MATAMISRVLHWLRDVPGNLVADVVFVSLGAAAAWLSGKVAHRRRWSLGDPSKLAIFIAEDAQELVRKKDASYVRRATGVGQVRALAHIAPSLRKAYRDAALGKLVMSSAGIERDLTSDLITLGGSEEQRCHARGDDQVGS